MYLYEKNGQTAKIIACRSYDTIAVIPEYIHQFPVTEIGAYAFSDSPFRTAAVEKSRKSGGIWYGENNIIQESEDQIPHLCGERLVELHMPASVEKIGNYAFYNCDRLQKVSCYSTIADVGSGLFTGCTAIKTLDMKIDEKKHSCLKEFVTELKQTLTVNYRCLGGNGRLVFPEYYEEAIENTPARIFRREMHGCGHRYRYCFHNNQFDFQEYDTLFPYAKVQEPEELLIQLVLGRLRFPIGLTEPNRNVYKGWLGEHLVSAGIFIVEQWDYQDLMWFAETFLTEKEPLDQIIEATGRTHDLQAVSYLMDLRHHKFKAGRKNFSI